MGEGSDAELNESLKDDFWISKYPVTQAQFAEFVTGKGYAMEDLWTEARDAGIWQKGKVKGFTDSEFRQAPAQYRDPFTLSNHPVVGITWYEALAFTRWLDKHLKNQKLLRPELSVSMVTEQQWEKTARGGENVPSKPITLPVSALASYKAKHKMKENPEPKRVYPWGEETDPNRANYDETRVGTTNAVGCFPEGVSPYGCEEMGGNAHEWCLTKYDKPEDNKTTGEDVRVVRGGSCVGSHVSVRCSCRGGSVPDAQVVSFGFRLVLSPTSDL